MWTFIQDQILGMKVSGNRGVGTWAEKKEVRKPSVYAGFRTFNIYSNSIVPGGFDVMS